MGLAIRKHRLEFAVLCLVKKKVTRINFALFVKSKLPFSVSRLAKWFCKGKSDFMAMGHCFLVVFGF